jgi:hypothetical protein
MKCLSTARTGNRNRKSDEVLIVNRYNFLLENVTKASLGVGLAFFAFGTSLTAYWVIRHGALSKDLTCSHCLLTFYGSLTILMAS